MEESKQNYKHRICFEGRIKVDKIVTCSILIFLDTTFSYIFVNIYFLEITMKSHIFLLIYFLEITIKSHIFLLTYFLEITIKSQCYTLYILFISDGAYFDCPSSNG